MKKKIVALMLTGTLLAGMPMTVSATSFTDNDPGNKGEVDSEGTINVVTKEIYQVTLPTGSAFEFTIDPQGLLGTADDKTYPDGTEGLIVATEEKGAVVKNLSSVPIKVTVDAFVGGKTGPAVYDKADVNLMNLEQIEIVNSGIDNNMLLAFDITHDEATIATEADIKTDNVNQQVIAIEANGKTGSEAGTQITFALNQANYEFKDGSYTKKTGTDEGGDAVGMRVSGLVNANADWKGYGNGASDKKIFVKAIYTFDKLSVDYEAAAFDGRAHGTLADEAPVYYEGEGEEYVTGSGALVIPFNLGSGTKEEKIDEIAVDGSPAVVIPADEYKVYNGEIIFKSTGEKVKANIVEAADSDTTPKAVKLNIKTKDNAENETTKSVTVNVLLPAAE